MIIDLVVMIVNGIVIIMMMIVFIVVVVVVIGLDGVMGDLIICLSLIWVI